MPGFPGDFAMRVDRVRPEGHLSRVSKPVRIAVVGTGQICLTDIQRMLAEPEANLVAIGPSAPAQVLGVAHFMASAQSSGGRYADADGETNF